MPHEMDNESLGLLRYVLSVLICSSRCWPEELCDPRMGVPLDSTVPMDLLGNFYGVNSVLNVIPWVCMKSVFKWYDVDKFSFFKQRHIFMKCISYLI